MSKAEFIEDLESDMRTNKKNLNWNNSFEVSGLMTQIKDVPEVIIKRIADNSEEGKTFGFIGGMIAKIAGNSTKLLIGINKEKLPDEVIEGVFQAVADLSVHEYFKEQGWSNGKKLGRAVRDSIQAEGVSENPQRIKEIILEEAAKNPFYMDVKPPKENVTLQSLVRKSASLAPYTSSNSKSDERASASTSSSTSKQRSSHSSSHKDEEQSVVTQSSRPARSYRPGSKLNGPASSDDEGQDESVATQSSRPARSYRRHDSKLNGSASKSSQERSSASASSLARDAEEAESAKNKVKQGSSSMSSSTSSTTKPHGKGSHANRQ